MISGIKLLPRNLIYNAVGVAIPSLAWMLTIPVLVNRLGEQSYGVYVVAMSVAGMLGFLELGLTSAATKYVADVEVRSNTKKLEQIISSNLFLYIGLGGMVIILFAFAAPNIAPLVFHDTDVEQPNLILVIRLVGVLFAITLVRNALSSVPRGFQRYDIYNGIQVGYAIGLALTQVAIVIWGGGVVALMLGNLVLTTASLVGFTLFICKTLPGIRLIRFPDLATLRVLFAFGMYMVLSSAAGMLLLNIDKIIVARALGGAMVTYYAVPAQLVTRIHGIGAAITSVLFPLASEIQSIGDVVKLRILYLRSMRLVMLITGLASVFLSTFAREILSIWIDPDFAVISTSVLVLISLGTLFFALSIVPYYILLGMGHPREMAVLHLVVALFGVLCISLGVAHLGLVGVATGRMVGMGAMIIFPGFVQRLLTISWKESLGDGYGRTLVYSVIGISIGVLLSHQLVARLVFYPLFVMALLAWGNVKQEDWEVLRSMSKRVLACLPVLSRLS